MSFMIRDGRDGYLSALRNPKVKVNTVSLYGEIWKLSVRAYLKATQQERVKLIRYEELCSNPEIVMTEVMSFLDESLQITQLASNSYSKTKMRSRRLDINALQLRKFLIKQLVNGEKK
ncbi:MAG: sulfotransferase [Nostocaceae cyanobacterium CSU_2_110]|nr:sulfotransferase [Nostocaceae cyanobacterium CSU_2_110]